MAIHILKHSTRKYSGQIIVQNDMGEVKEEGDTVRCCHCGEHFLYGKLKEKGWCWNCDQPTCGGMLGGQDCLVCKPFVKKLEEEQRKADAAAFLSTIK